MSYTTAYFVGGPIDLQKQVVDRFTSDVYRVVQSRRAPSMTKNYNDKIEEDMLEHLYDLEYETKSELGDVIVVYVYRGFQPYRNPA